MEKLPAIGYTKQDNDNFKSILGEKAPVGTQIENGFCFEFEIWTKISDNLNAMTQNFDKLLQEKNELITRTGGSIKKFLEDGVKMPEHIKSNNKTKKVRFNL